MALISLDKNAQILYEGKITILVDKEPPPPDVSVWAVVSSTLNGITITSTGAQRMAYNLPNDKQLGLKISYVDSHGNPAEVDADPTWETSDTEIATVEPTSGKEVMLKPTGKAGNCQVSAKADADLGEGMRELVSLFDVTVIAGEAVAGTIEPVGEPQPMDVSGRRGAHSA